MTLFEILVNAVKSKMNTPALKQNVYDVINGLTDDSKTALLIDVNDLLHSVWTSKLLTKH